MGALPSRSPDAPVTSTSTPTELIRPTMETGPLTMTIWGSTVMLPTENPSAGVPSTRVARLKLLFCRSSVLTWRLAGRTVSVPTISSRLPVTSTSTGTEPVTV